MDLKSFKIDVCYICSKAGSTTIHPIAKCPICRACGINELGWGENETDFILLDEPPLFDDIRGDFKDEDTQPIWRRGFPKI